MADYREIDDMIERQQARKRETEEQRKTNPYRRRKSDALMNKDTCSDTSTGDKK